MRLTRFFLGFLGVLGVGATISCEQSSNYGYPFCVSVPPNLSNTAKLPVILFLSGSGARNTEGGESVKKFATYDGFGKLAIGEEDSPAGRKARSDFVVVVPVSPFESDTKNKEGARHWWPQKLDAVLARVTTLVPQADIKSQLHVSGYSMGSRGTWRYAIAHSNNIASISPSAGGAEQAGDGNLQQEPADPTFPELAKIINIPCWQFAGYNDDTAGYERAQETQDMLDADGSKVAKLDILQLTHQDLSTRPFSVELMDWMLEQTNGRPGSVTTTTTTAASATTTRAGTTTSAPSRTNTLTQSVTTTRNKTRWIEVTVTEFIVFRKTVTIHATPTP